MLYLSDFTISASFGTESKDFLRSINTAPKSFLRSMPLMIESQKNITAVSVEWCCLKLTERDLINRSALDSVEADVHHHLRNSGHNWKY